MAQNDFTTITLADLTAEQRNEWREQRNELMRNRSADDFDGAEAARTALPVWLMLRTAAALAVWAARRPKLAAALERARSKAEYHLAGGLEVRRVGSALLVPSGTRGGVIHRVAGARCSCEAGQSNRLCWHLTAAALVA